MLASIQRWPRYNATIVAPLGLRGYFGFLFYSSQGGPSAAEGGVSRTPV
jgi:hypothetical protein